MMTDPAALFRKGKQKPYDRNRAEATMSGIAYVNTVLMHCLLPSPCDHLIYIIKSKVKGYLTAVSSLSTGYRVVIYPDELPFHSSQTKQKKLFGIY